MRPRALPVLLLAGAFLLGAIAAIAASRWLVLRLEPLAHDLSAPPGAAPAGAPQEVEPVREARAKLEEARRSDGGESLVAARAIDGLVRALYASGRATNPEALELAEEALRLREKHLGPDDTGLAVGLNNLSAILYQRGQLERARVALERARSIHVKRSPGSLEHAKAASNLAEIERSLGDLLEARKRYEEALSIVEPRAGERGFRELLASTWNNLGLLAHDIRDLEEARKLYEKAREAWEGDSGERARLAQVLNSLGRVFQDLGRPDEAHTRFEHALAIWNELPSPDLKEKASVINNLGYLLHQRGDLDRASTLYDEALSLRRTLLGPDHPDTAWTLTNQGLLFWARGDRARAGELLEKALEARRRVQGEGHPLVGQSLTLLAALRADAGDPAGALAAALSAERIRRTGLELAVPALAERQATCMLQVEVPGLGASSLDVCISLATVPGSLPEEALRDVWDSLIHARGLVLEGVARGRRRLRQAADPETRRLCAEAASAATRLANLWTRGPAGLTREAHLALLEEARAWKERSESALALRNAAAPGSGATEGTGWVRVKASLDELPARTALVAYTLYERLRPRPSGPPRTETAYLAFAASRDAAGPRVVDLGSAADIDALVARWSAEVVAGFRAGDDTARTALASCRRAGADLRGAVWDPIARELGASERVFIVPDGSLNLVSFAALPAGEDKYLAEEGPLLHYLGAERDLHGFEKSPAASPRGTGLLCIGGASFDAAGFDVAPATPTASQPGERLPASGVLFPATRFEELPATVKEVEEVAAIFVASRAGGGASEEALRLTGSDATEGSFKRLAPGRRVLHLATHGFFLDASSLENDAGTRGLEISLADPAVVSGARALVSPLMLSGLVLAGANRRQGLGAEEEDGILTAEEVATLDLTGVEWAVLSACKSGAGEVMKGEGVFGLRRAFQVAGAGTQVLSLWPVEDDAAREWMVRLYDARFRRELGASEAAREASLAVLRARRAAGKTPHPFFWAAFVAAGEWR